MTKEEIKKKLYKILKKKKTFDEKFDFIRELNFQLEMVDRWQEEDKILYEALDEIRKEFFSGKL